MSNFSSVTCVKMVNVLDRCQVLGFSWGMPRFVMEVMKILSVSRWLNVKCEKDVEKDLVKSLVHLTD